MRLLYLGDTGSPHFRGWAGHFAAAGNDVHVMHLAYHDKGAPIEGVTEHPSPWVDLGTRAAWRLSVASIWRLWRRLKPELIHSHPIAPSGYLVELGRLAPHVSTAWGSEVLLATERQRPRLRKVATGAELLTAPSRQLLSALEAAGAKRGDLRWVPWGISREWRRTAEGVSTQEARELLGLSLDRRIVLSPRGTKPIYRQDVFLKAFARVRDVHADALALITGPSTRGSPNGAGAELRRLAEHLGIEGDVIFRQDYPHHEMPLVYRAASVCVSVPETDGAPASVTEAMAIGVPLCVSRLPWAEEPPYSESRMRLVPVGDHLQLADEICALLGSDNAADVAANRDLAWRVAGRERCYGRFEPEYERLIAAAA